MCLYLVISMFVVKKFKVSHSYSFLNFMLCFYTSSSVVPINFSESVGSQMNWLTEFFCFFFMNPVINPNIVFYVLNKTVKNMLSLISL